MKKTLPHVFSVTQIRAGIMRSWIGTEEAEFPADGFRNTCAFYNSTYNPRWKNFIEHVQEEGAPHDREERERRAQAMKFAEASANFEGCYVPGSARPVIARYINGEIDGEIDTETVLKILLV